MILDQTTACFIKRDVGNKKSSNDIINKTSNTISPSITTKKVNRDLLTVFISLKKCFLQVPFVFLQSLSVQQQINCIHYNVHDNG